MSDFCFECYLNAWCLCLCCLFVVISCAGITDDWAISKKDLLVRARVCVCVCV